MSTAMMMASFVRRVLWTCVGALVVRPLLAEPQPIPIATRGVSRRTKDGLRDGT